MTITPRAREQTAREVKFWLEDHPEQVSVALESVWVDDFDGSVYAMRRAVVEEFAKYGWTLHTIKKVKTLVKAASPG